jgi:(p)ppGpp synthase/HD superfamily hydrolase
MRRMASRDESLWQRAAAFAARAHLHAVRKDGETPYVSHVFRVAMTIRHVFEFDDETMLAAALLHDTIEDTGTDYDEILEAFGAEVADLVALMTKDMRLVESAREEMYDDQLRKGPWQARLLKLADVYDNLSDAVDGKRSLGKMIEKTKRALTLARNDPELKEAREIVEALLKQAETK